MKRDKIIYSLSVEDVMTVIECEWIRKLTPEELNKVIDEIPENIPWYDCIFDSIQNVIKFLENKLKGDEKEAFEKKDYALAKYKKRIEEEKKQQEAKPNIS